MTITNMKKYCAFTRKQLFTHIHLNERKINNEFPLLKVEGINRKKQSKTTTIRWANHIRTMHTLYSTFSHEWFWVNTDYNTINLRISAVINSQRQWMNDSDCLRKRSALSVIGRSLSNHRSYDSVYNSETISSVTKHST